MQLMDFHEVINSKLTLEVNKILTVLIFTLLCSLCISPYNPGISKELHKAAYS